MFLLLKTSTIPSMWPRHTTWLAQAYQGVFPLDRLDEHITLLAVIQRLLNLQWQAGDVIALNYTCTQTSATASSANSHRPTVLWALQNSETFPTFNQHSSQHFNPCRIIWVKLLQCKKVSSKPVLKTGQKRPTEAYISHWHNPNLEGSNKTFPRKHFTRYFSHFSKTYHELPNISLTAVSFLTFSGFLASGHYVINSYHDSVSVNLIRCAMHATKTFIKVFSNRRRPPGRPRTTWMKNINDDLSLLDLGIHEARDLVQNRPLCRLTSLHSAMHS